MLLIALFFFQLLVLRSETRLMQQSQREGIFLRNLSVKILPNFSELCLKYLAEQNADEVGQQFEAMDLPILQMNPTNPTHAPHQISERRQTMASCQNIYEIDGKIEEVGCSAGSSTIYDPFRRTRHVPFEIAGRRGSISMCNNGSSVM